MQCLEVAGGTPRPESLAEAPGRCTYRWQVSEVDVHGSLFSFPLKAWKYSSGEVWWECRQWLPTLFEGVKDASAAHLYKNHNQTWAEFLSLADRELAAQWLRGRRARQIVEDSARPFVRDEDACTSAALLLILCGEALLGQHLSRRHRARAMCQAVCVATITADAAQEAMQVPSGDGGPCLCDEGCDEHGRCQHLQKSFLLTASSGGAPQRSVPLLIEALMRASVACGACKAELAALILRLCTGLDARLEDLGWATDNVKDVVHALAPSGRRRRLDEDFREAVVTKAMKLGHAPSLGAYCRVIMDGDDSAAFGIRDERLGRYLVSCRKTHAEVHRLSLALDGSKLGQPLEETEMYLTWNGDLELAVLPAWLRSRPAEPGENADAREFFEWQARWEAFVNNHADVRGKGVGSVHRIANQHYLKALDHFLSFSHGCSLAHFKPQVAVSPLAAGESLYYLSDAAVQTSRGSNNFDPDRRRACVHDKVANSTRLLLPSPEDGKRPQLHVVLDEGSIGLPTMLYLYLKPVIRGSFHPDPCHRVMNNITNSLKMSGLWIVLLEVLVVMNLPSRPWNTDAQWQTLVGCAKETIKNAGFQNQIFQTLYAPIIADESDGTLPAEFGESAHMAETWRRLGDASFLRKKGTKVRLGRWMAWFDRFAEFDGEWNSMYFFLLHMGLARKWWPNLESTPLYKPIESLPSMALGALDPKEAKPAKKAPVKSSNKDEMKDLREVTKNAAHMSCCILSSTRTRRLAKMISVVIAPIRKSFGCMIERLKTTRGTRSWLLSMACGGYAPVLEEVIATVGGIGKVAQYGFAPADSLFQASFQEWERAEDRIIAECMGRLTVALISQQTMWSAFYSHQPPFSFLKLLETATREASLRELKAMWEKLLEDERAASTDDFKRQMLFQMLWPRMTIVREWFILLDEFSFAVVPPSVVEDLNHMSRAFATTKCIEDVFKVLRGYSRHSPNSQLCRKSRWLVSKESQVLSDYGRRQVDDAGDPETILEGKAVKILGKDFTGEGYSLSIGAGCYDDLAGTATWPTPSPQTILQTPLLTWCWAASNDRWNDLNLAWTSLLSQPGFFLKHKDRAEVWLSLHASVNCVMGLRVRQREVGGVRFLHFFEGFALRELLMPVYVKSDELDKWKAAKAVLVPPGAARRQAMDMALPAEVPRTCLWEMEGDPVKLALLAGLQGFPNMTGPRLDKLTRHYGLDVRGKTVAALVEALLVHIAPGLPKERIEEIVSKRVGNTKRDASPVEGCSVLLKEGAVACAEDVLDQQEQEELQKTTTKLLRKIRLAKPGAPQPATASGPASNTGGATSSSSSSGAAAGAAGNAPPALVEAAAPAKARASFSGYSTPAQAQVYAPPGAHMKLDNVRFFRWTAVMENLPSPPRSRSLTFGKDADGAKRHAALLHCYQWAWARHLELHPGSTCPHEWDEVPQDFATP